MSKQVKVRIAVCVDPTGDWSSVGWKTTREDELISVAEEGVNNDGYTLYWVEATLDVPEYGKVVQGTVNHRGGSTADAPPAEGEAAELVAWLRGANWDGKRQSLATRAADLLQQRHHKPVPVAERLPGPEDCDAEGRCWWGLEESDDYEACWTLRKMNGIPFDNTHWLPAAALSLPIAEV